MSAFGVLSVAVLCLMAGFLAGIGAAMTIRAMYDKIKTISEYE